MDQILIGCVLQSEGRPQQKDGGKMNKFKANEIRDSERYIHAKLEELENLKNIATHMTAVYSDMPKGRNQVGNKRQEILCKMADLEDVINCEIRSYISRIKDIEDAIQKIEEAGKKAILTERYINGKTLEEMGDCFHYSKQGIKKKLVKAEESLR